MASSEERPPIPEVDRVRLERMFTAHHATVWRMLRRRGLTSDAAADATQQTFSLAMERLADIRPESERSFLIETALRMAHPLGRKTVRWELDQDMDLRVSAERDAGDKRADIQLCFALSKVNPELAEVFVLYEMEGMSAPEIAAPHRISGCPNTDRLSTAHLYPSDFALVGGPSTIRKIV